MASGTPGAGEGSGVSIRVQLLATVVAVTLACALVVDYSGAAFSTTTSNPGSSVAADALAAPSGLTGGNGGLVAPCRITLNWTASASAWATGYRLYRSTSQDSGYAAFATVPYGTNTQQQNHASGTYYFRVVAYQSGWESAPAQSVAIATAVGCL